MTDMRRSFNSLDDIDFAVKRIEELEDKLARALEALQQLIIEYDEVDLAYDEPKSMTEAYVVARTTLIELTGEEP